MDFSQQILQHQLLLFQWKLKFLSSTWLLHVVSERCDIARFFLAGDLITFRTLEKSSSCFLFTGFLWDLLGCYQRIQSDRLRLQNYYSFGGHSKYCTVSSTFFCDWFWAFHSFWTHGVRVWIRIKWITFRLTGTFKEKEKNLQICGTLKYSGNILLWDIMKDQKRTKLWFICIFFYFRGLHTAL